VGQAKAFTEAEFDRLLAFIATEPHAGTKLGHGANDFLGGLTSLGDSPVTPWRCLRRAESATRRGAFRSIGYQRAFTRTVYLPPENCATSFYAMAERIPRGVLGAACYDPGSIPNAGSRLTSVHSISRRSTDGPASRTRAVTQVGAHSSRSSPTKA
jgi:hypothetical protein